MDGELFTKRELLEGQPPLVLRAHKVELLRRLSDLESEVHLVNDVLDGYGVDSRVAAPMGGAALLASFSEVRSAETRNTI